MPPREPLRCRACGGSNLRSVLDLGATPPCESFLTADQLDTPEMTYPLHLRLCEDCLLLQIPALITPQDTFSEYAYFSSFSTSWVEHAGLFVEGARRRLGLDAGSFVVEIASNDGYLLQHVVAAGIPCLGIEPSVNVSAAARDKGVPTLTRFLDEDCAAQVVAEHGHADLVVANNVWAHIPDLLGFTRALRALVADDGWVSIEVHHALSLVTKAQYDTIYHEHFQYWTVLAARTALAGCGLDLVDVERLPTHGGSIRLWSRPSGLHAVPEPSVQQVLDEEIAAGLDRPEGYDGLAPRVAQLRRDLLDLLIGCTRHGLKVAGYGAPGKGNTLLNHCGVRPDLLPWLVDKNPYKHGRFTPGTRIPIHPVERIEQDRPDVIVVLPWNLRAEIDEQLAFTSAWGARLVYPMPMVSITEAGR